MSLFELPADAGNDLVNVVIETPRGSRAKLRYEPALQAFQLSRALALGLAYPYDWGFVPSTTAPDGDPLDAMVYHDIATYPGVVIACRPLGVLKVRQKEPGSPAEDNDRLLVVPAHEQRVDDARDLADVVRGELERFFALAVLDTRKKVRFTGWGGPEEAARLVAKARKAFDRARARRGS